MIEHSIFEELYSRQIMMNEIGESGQKKLAKASVLVVGCGGLGSPALNYLTAMGIGHIGLCDSDVVTVTNLNRQILYTFDDLGKPKAAMAEMRLLALNPGLNTTVYNCGMSKDLAERIIPDYDIVLDCLDNFKTRYILNDACVAACKPLVHAGVEAFRGQLMTITPGTGPCLRCLFPIESEKQEPDKPIGVVGPAPGVLGALQALEALKYLLDLPVSNNGLVIFDGLNMCLEKVPLAASPDCICRSNCIKSQN